MAVAYSPIRTSNTNTKSGTNIFTMSTDNNENIATSSPSDYARKLLDLKNAMELLKTPPPVIQNSNSNSHPHNLSYTPMKSSTLTHQISPAFASSIDESMEISMDISDDSTANNVNTTDTNNTSLLEAYHDNESVSISVAKNRHEVFSSPTPNFSSPYLSSDEMKKRLEATRDAFQKSLEAQKRRLRSSYFNDDHDSSSFLFDSDLSIDSLKSTKNQLDKIKKEINELIESDIEEIERHRSKEEEKEEEENFITAIPSESFITTFFKYFVIFSISSIVFTYLFIIYTPILKSNYLTLLELMQTGNVLDKIEEFLNFLVQDD